jgi:2,3-bisphosphoglycerate-dependent phosphoglycerate mutase
MNFKSFTLIVFIIGIGSCKNDDSTERNPKSLQQIKEEKDATAHADSLISGKLADKTPDPIALSYDISKAPIFYDNGDIKLPDGKKMNIPNFNDPKTNILFVIRHAEKDENDGEDPNLTAQGLGRAQALVKMFENVTFNRMASTNKKRTMKTMEPLLKSKGVPTDVYQKDMQSAFLESVMETKGRKYFIVGHSNTVPELLNELKGTKDYKTIDENDFSNIYVVMSQGIGKSTIITLKY